MAFQTEFNTRSGTTPCPACAESIKLDAVMLHEIVECGICAGEFEVLNLDPFELVEVDDDEEDYGE